MLYVRDTVKLWRVPKVDKSLEHVKHKERLKELGWLGIFIPDFSELP